MENKLGNEEKTAEKKITIHQLFQKAKAGDTNAANAFCIAVQPLIERLCKVPYFRDRLGIDEIQSTLGLTLAKLLAERKELPEATQATFLLKRILRMALIDHIRRLEFKALHEKPLGDFKEMVTETFEDDRFSDKALTDGNALNPEHICLRKDLRSEVRKAVQQLPEKERTMIHALYFQNKPMKEITQNLNCTFQNAYDKRKKSFKRLQKILEPCVYA